MIEEKLYKKNNHYYEKIGDEIICIDDKIHFDIPESWKFVHLFNIIDSISTKKYQILQSEIQSTGNIPVISQSQKYIEGYSNNEEKVLNINNPIIAFGDHTKVIKYIDFNFIVGADGLKILNPILINPKFLFYELEYFKTNMKDRGYSRHFQFLNKILYPLPPIDEQERIVEKIEGLFTNLDRGVKELGYTLKQVNNYEKSIISEAIQGKLVPQNSDDEATSILLEKIRKEREKLIKEKKIKRNKHESVIYKEDGSYYEKIGKEVKCIDEEIPFEIPESWEWCRLDFIGDWKAGSTPLRNNTSYYENGTIPWLKTGDLNNGMITKIPEKITQLALKETSVRLNPIGSVLIAMYGATIGKLGILELEATTNQACCACILFGNIYNKYLFYYLMSQKEEFIKKSEGGAQPNISRMKIINHLFSLPPLKEQKRVIEKIEKELYNIKNMVKTIDESLNEAQKLRHSILKKAFEGKLVKQQSDDEPVEKLLERIKVKKTKSKSNKKNKRIKSKNNKTKQMKLI
ncbi:MAG: restriction endonuclease subunit S [Mycoplasmataceae bacterium]|jgi:type I restriction enzyme S subunit|nr:restriction endonuclease subunit S [Mycoplasmataceae bacterium]